MLHSKHITVPTTSSESSPVRTRFIANRGVVYRVWVTFPPGCAGLVKMRIFHEGHPFLPIDEDAYICGDSFTFVYPVMYEIKSAPEQITIEAWNEDSTYQHTIDVQFLIIPKHWVLPVGAYEGIIASLKSLFGPERGTF